MLEEFWPTVDRRASDVTDRLAEWVHPCNWDRPYEALKGSRPIDRVCEHARKTPLHGEVADAYEPDKERIQIRDHGVDIA